jgi:hypothetical protein
MIIVGCLLGHFVFDKVLLPGEKKPLAIADGAVYLPVSLKIC